MFVFQFISSDCDNGGLPNKEEYLRQLCRNIANTMYRPDPDAYLVRMCPDDLGLTTSDLTASRNYRSMYKVGKMKNSRVRLAPCIHYKLSGMN